jgi:dCMP deaminase
MITQEYKIDRLKFCYSIAQASPDLSTQNGAVLIDSEGKMIGAGINKLPIGIQVTPERLARPAKYMWTEHAERNAIYDAARSGHKTDGATLICPFVACHDCARGIVQAGISLVVTHTAMTIPGRWSESVDVGFEILKEAGVEVEFIDGHLGASPILFNGEVLNP